MKRKYLFIVPILLAIILLIGIDTFHASAKKDVCSTITQGSIFTTDGELIETGYSEWGYNYQGNMFNGMYCDYHPIYRPGGAQYDWCQENYGNDVLIMKWNDGWLSNKDCDGDGLLDRHYGYTSYIGSGAWLTNHIRGVYEEQGKSCSWNYFVKIVAVPSDAEERNNIWYMADGMEIGESIWGSFAIIQSIYNDTCTGEHGIEYLSPVGPGFGKF